MSFVWYLLKKWGREAGWLLLFPFMLAVYPFIKILLWFVDEYEEFKDQR